MTVQVRKSVIVGSPGLVGDENERIRFHQLEMRLKVSWR